jgi:FkbM family methyltransferase
MKIENILNHSFASAPLRGAPLALDCGANEGGFARWLSAHTPAEVHSFEPDPRLFAKLPPLPRVTWHPLAVDGESGELDLALGEETCSSALYREHEGQQTVRVKKTSLDDFCRAHGITAIDLLKIDIEGAELALLERTSDALLAATAQITVEFHDFFRREDVPRIEGIFRRLEGLGFYGVRFSHFFWSDCLFLNRRLVPVSAADRLSIQVAGKYMPGIARFVRRQLRKLTGHRGGGLPRR